MCCLVLFVVHSDDEWTDDEEDVSPIDSVEPFVLFAETLALLAAHQPAKHQQLTATVQASAEASAALAAVLQQAEVKRAEKAAEAARAQQ